MSTFLKWSYVYGSLKWSYVYGSLQVNDYDTLDSAVVAAAHLADDGLESLQCIEDTATGRVYSREEVWDLDEPRQERERADRDARLRPTHIIEVLAPEGPLREVHDSRRWSAVDWAHSAEGAAVEADVWRARVGHDRVRITTR